MRLFTKLYDWVLKWASHKRATWALGGLSFAESSFFPIPPDVLLAPMVLSKPNQAWYFAFLTTVASVLGGVLGYIIGAYFFDAILPMIAQMHMEEELERAKVWFADYGIWIVFIAGFSPIPYKVFTITAGALSMSLPLFIIASAIGRGLRFFLVAGIVKVVGDAYEPILRKYIEPLGYFLAVLIAIAIAYVTFK